MRGELCVTVVDEMASLLPLLGQVHTEVPGLLGHPCGIGVWTDSRYINLPAADVNEEQDEIVDQAGLCPDFLAYEVTGPQGLGVYLDKLVPAALATIGARIEAVIL